MPSEFDGTVASSLSSYTEVFGQMTTSRVDQDRQGFRKRYTIPAELDLGHNVPLDTP